MKRIYLEPNAINRVLDLGWSGKEFRELLFKAGYTPVVGLHCIYEHARGYISGRQNDKIASLFKIMRDLDSEYVKQAGGLIAEEANKATTRASIDPFLAGEDLRQVIAEVERLSEHGLFDLGRSFIVNREKELANDIPALAGVAIDVFKSEKQRDPEEVKGLKTYEDVLVACEPELANLIRLSAANLIDERTAGLIAERIDDFPYLRAIARSHIYFNFVCWVHQRQPRIDIYDDHRHVAEAAYCDAFVTQDQKLLRIAPKLNPDLEVIPWDSLKCSMEDCK